MAVGEALLESDGKALHVDLLYTVAKNRLCVVDGWLGISQGDGKSGETIALGVDGREYQVTVPTALAAVKGEDIYIDIADVTGHYPDDTAWNKDGSGTTAILLGKATQDQDANDIVTMILAAPPVGDLTS